MADNAIVNSTATNSTQAEASQQEESNNTQSAAANADVDFGNVSGAVLENKPKEIAQQAVPKKHKLKVDGKEIELDEQELYRRASLGSAAYKRMEEARAARLQAEEFFNKLKTNFTDILDDPRMGFDESQKRQLLEDYYRRKYIEPETLTPEQRKFKEQEAELQRYREAEKAKTQKEEQERIKLLEEHHFNTYRQLIKQGLESSGLPQNEFCAKRMGQLLAKNIQLGLELTPEQLGSMVREDYQNELKAILGASDGDALLNILGDDVATKIRKADLKRYKAGTFQPKVQELQPVQQSNNSGSQQFGRLDDFVENLKKKLGQ